MEGYMTVGVASTMAKFIGSNPVMWVSKLEALVHQRCLSKVSRRSATAPMMTRVEQFGVLRDCCTREAHLLLHDHFAARLATNRAAHAAVDEVNRQLEDH
jgi:hypothetical protein